MLSVLCARIKHAWNIIIAKLISMKGSFFEENHRETCLTKRRVCKSSTHKSLVTGMGKFARNVCERRACPGLVLLPTCVFNGGTNKLQVLLSLPSSPTHLLMIYTRGNYVFFPLRWFPVLCGVKSPCMLIGIFSIEFWTHMR